MQSSDRSLCRYVANITYCKMDRRFLNLEAIARWAPLEGETRSTLFASSWKNSFVRLECAVSFVSKGALHKAMVFYVSRRKHQKKTSTTSATKLKMLQSKLLDRSLCFSIVHIAKQTAQACILRFQCELIQSCKATLQSSPKFFLWHLFWSVHVRSLAPNSAQPWLAY